MPWALGRPVWTRGSWPPYAPLISGYSSSNDVRTGRRKKKSRNTSLYLSTSDVIQQVCIVHFVWTASEAAPPDSLNLATARSGGKLSRRDTVTVPAAQ